MISFDFCLKKREEGGVEGGGGVVKINIKHFNNYVENNN